MKDHVSHIVKTTNFHLRNIARVRKFLTFEATKQAVISLALSRLDYCNSLLAGLPSSLIYKLQLVQNFAARVIYRKPKYDHVSSLLKSLHWLPVNKRVMFKIILLVFKCLRGLAPIYLSEMISYHQSERSLRSTADANRLAIKSSRLVTYGDRAFAIIAPRLWNKLPKKLRAIDSLTTFKKELKTHLFET